MEHIYNKPKGPNRAPTNGNSFHTPSIVQAYDPSTTSWTRVVTSGEVPRPTAGAASTLLQDVVFVFGGFCHWDEEEGGEQAMSDHIYRLDLETKTWKNLRPSGLPPPSSDKGIAWSYEGDVFIFGGYGDMRRDSEGIDAKYRQELNSFSHREWPRGWNNALVRYNVKLNRWEWPETRGTPPSPRAACAGGVLGDCVYIFGGRTIHRRMNDLHQLNLKTMTWTTIIRGTENLDPFGPPDPSKPEPRSLHSLTPATPSSLVLYGGLGQLASPLNDCWILHVEGGDVYWEEVELPYDHGEVRCWHGAGMSSDGELIIHSGLTQEFYLTRIDLDDHPESVLHLRFGVMSLRRLCLEVVVDMAEKSVKESNNNFLEDIEELPANLRTAVMERIDEDDFKHYKPPPKEQQYQRETLKAGI